MDELKAAIEAWRNGESGWDAVLKAAKGVKPAAHKSYVETGWDHFEDEFPQAGTLDELVALRLTPSQFREVVEALKAGD